jgi:hypothetical protein
MRQARPAAGPRAGLLGATVLTVLAAAGDGRAQAPQRGDVQKVQVITVAMQVGSTEKETRHVTYTPPPGWYVRSHTVDCLAKYGNSSYAVATVPQNWAWVSEEKVTESYNLLIDLAARAKDQGLQARFRHERDAMLTDLRRVRSTHHALVVEATARGEGFWKGGGGIQLTVTAELVYIGTNEDVGRAVGDHQARLK